MNRRQLLSLYKSEELVEKIMTLDRLLQDKLIQTLPKELTLEEIITLWNTAWKNVSSEGFLAKLQELSYKELKSIKNLSKLIDYWLNTSNQHLREVIKRVITELLSKRRFKLNKELILNLYFVFFDSQHPCD